MSIKRYEHMPFYFYPHGQSIVGKQDTLLNLIDWAVDAHEESRNEPAHFLSFYNRSVYVFDNFFRYQNPTMANIMFDTQAPTPTYDKLNSQIRQQTMKFYLAAASTHMLGLMYLSFFFRYRRVGFVPSVAIGSAYYWAFENINNILYKVIVDREILSTARSFGLNAHAQPCGTLRNRGLNFK